MLKTLALVLCASSALAVAPASRAEETSDRAEAARRLLGISFPEASYQKLVDSVSSQLPREAQPDVKAMMPSYSEMADFELGMFVKYFTVEEMAAIAKFYQSPAGAKSLKVMPEVSTDVQGFVMARMQRELPKLIEKWKKNQGAAPTSGSKRP